MRSRCRATARRCGSALEMRRCQPGAVRSGESATLSTRTPHGSGLAAPRIAGIAVTDWQSNTAPKLDGKPLQLERYERSRSLAITPDGGRFVLGTEYRLRAFDTRGQEQWKKPAPGTAWGVNVTGDGRLVLAAYGDGTIRWHRMSDGQELLALFVDKDDLRWVAWTPSGYYMASPGGEDLIGWHVNRGWDQAADFFPASRFRERFSRPDIARLVLETLDEDAAIKQANRQAIAGRKMDTSASDCDICRRLFSDQQSGRRHSRLRPER